VVAQFEKTMVIKKAVKNKEAWALLFMWWLYIEIQKLSFSLCANSGEKAKIAPCQRFSWAGPFYWQTERDRAHTTVESTGM